MKVNFSKIKYRPPYAMVISITIFLAVVIILGVTAIIFKEVYAGKFYPGIKVGGTNMGGMSYEEARVMLQDRLDSIDEGGIEFEMQGEKVAIYPIQVSASDPDLSFELYSINIDEPLTQAYALGRDRGIILNFIDFVRGLFGGRTVELKVDVSEMELEKALKTNFDELLTKAEETNVYFEGEDILVREGKAGEMIDYTYYIQEFENKLKILDSSTNEIVKQNYEPKISRYQAEQLIPKVEQILNRDSYFLKATVTRWWLKEPIQKEYTMYKSTIKDGIELKHNGEPYVGFSREVLQEYLENKLQDIEVKPRNAKFVFEAGRVREFQASQDGIEVDINKTTEALEQDLADTEKESSWIATTITKARITTQDVNDLGVETLLGVGRSSFAGSPRNRIHNIKTGAAAINGLIIEDGEEFSLVQALGDITAATGYLPELVIKGNRTVPEYGGGLCQIGTTLFRSVLDTGLKVTLRKNHAYRVQYYEPAGTDATIYDPWPDFRFVNDTGNPVLIQTRVSGYDLIFEFWGKSDGRRVVVHDPIIYNITKPGPTKYVETEDLEPGETDCIEHAVNGAEANLKTEIYYGDGSSREEDFYSKYRPWQEVCLVGIDPNKATSTEEIIEE